VFGLITRRRSLLYGLGLAVAGAVAPVTKSSEAGSDSVLAPKGDDPPRGSKAASSLEGAMTLEEIELRARDSMAASVYERVSAGAANEITKRWNREAFDRIRLRPRVLVDVAKLDTRIKLFGQDLAFPILLAPTGGHALVHPDGELATVRAAGTAGAIFVNSIASSFPIEEIARAARGPVWCQLFIKPDRGLTRELVERAENAGYKALCVTVDGPITGIREREWRVQKELPYRKSANGPGAVSAKIEPPGSGYKPAAPDKVTWDSVDWLRAFARVPILLKGILNHEDAERAVQAGVSGLIVSNHGGRQLDTVPATIDALPLISERVAGRIPVLVDGGVRRGTDVVKALALGASAVLIGRPYLYGLALGGADGVNRVIEILRTELEVAMALTGRPSIASIDRSTIWQS
jgi:4-hydroxymandelate oxidase